MSAGLADVFARTRSEGRAALIGYLPAGFPTPEQSVALINAMVAAGVDPYAGRVVSYLCAVTTTWWFNRTYTFTATAGKPRLRDRRRAVVVAYESGLVVPRSP